MLIGHQRRVRREIPLPNTQNNADARSWDLGQIVLTNPTESKLCPQQDPTISGVPGQSYPNNDQYNSAFTGQSITETCPEYYKEVSSLTSGYSATATSSISPDGTSYDSHYLIGNFYQYGTATAGTGIGLTGTAATDATDAGLTSAAGSICPKGWELPKAGRNISATETIFGVGPGQSYDIEGSFYGLLSKYRYNTGWVSNKGDGYIPIITSEARLDYDPLYIVRSGSVNSARGSYRYVGDSGYIWSSVVAIGTNQYSYALNIDTTNVYPSVNNSRYLGFPVRCLAK